MSPIFLPAAKKNQQSQKIAPAAELSTRCCCERSPRGSPQQRVDNSLYLFLLTRPNHSRTTARYLRPPARPQHTNRPPKGGSICAGANSPGGSGIVEGARDSGETRETVLRGDLSSFETSHGDGQGGVIG